MPLDGLQDAFRQKKGGLCTGNWSFVTIFCMMRSSVSLYIINIYFLKITLHPWRFKMEQSSFLNLEGLPISGRVDFGYDGSSKPPEYFWKDSRVALFHLSHLLLFYIYWLHHSHLCSRNHTRSYNELAHGQRHYLFCMVLDFLSPSFLSKLQFCIWNIYNLSEIHLPNRFETLLSWRVF